MKANRSIDGNITLSQGAGAGIWTFSILCPTTSCAAPVAKPREASRPADKRRRSGRRR